MSKATVLDPQLDRVSGGDFWHIDTGRTGAGSYIRTACNRRLSCWHLVPTQRLSSVARAEVCPGCIRSLTRNGGK
ncbi:MAG: hypothetical protein ACRDS9_07810 [Pseudonocardiaceae bacterium]